VNKFIPDMPCKLDDLSLAEELVDIGDFMVALDLENQFVQVRLHPDMREFLGFQMPGPGGCPVFYCFNVMPYGCKPAVAVVTRLLKPLKAFFHRVGIKFTIYVDDGRICAPTPDLCLSQLCFVIHVLQLAGWRIQWKKTIVTPSTSLLHLGFVTDSLLMKYFITPDKWTAVAAMLSRLLSLAGSAVPVLDSAALLGKLHSLRRSHGSIISVMSRSLQHQLGQHVDTHGWTGSFCYSAASLHELSFLLTHLPSFHGQHIPSAAAYAHVYDLHHTEAFKRLVADSDVDLPNLIVSDASQSHAFVYLADGTFTYARDYPFTAADAAASSSHRELLAVCLALESDGPFLLQRSAGHVYWQTDSENSARFMLHGSRRPSIQRIVVRIKELERNLCIILHPVWTPRSHPRLRLADAGTRLATSTDEWSVDRRDLAAVFHHFQVIPDVDCFASAVNAICPVFYSAVPQPGASAVNFFSQHLSPGPIYFVCPPVKLLAAAFRHLLTFRNVTAVFLLPDWPSTAFWPVFFPAGRLHSSAVAMLRFAPRFFATNSAPSLFTSRPRIPFLALLIVT
jgi:hypothetical protein